MSYRMRIDRPLRALFVDHDTDDFRVIRRIEFLQHFFGVGHLRDGFRRDERNRIKMLEPRANQGFQIIALEMSGNLPLQPLPGIARTFDEFDLIRHSEKLRHGSHGFSRSRFPCNKIKHRESCSLLIPANAGQN